MCSVLPLNIAITLVVPARKFYKELAKNLIQHFEEQKTPELYWSGSNQNITSSLAFCKNNLSVVRKA
jgi:hypothetical protein